MSSFAESNFNSNSYNTFRPSYSTEFLSLILDYTLKHKVSRDLNLNIVDVGTGPGTSIQALIPLLTMPTTITLTDPSAVMLEEAQKLLISKDNKPVQSENASPITTFKENHITFQFLQCTSEELPKFITEGSIDLVMAAECLHWISGFSDTCEKLLTLGGTFAYWGYVDPVFTFVDKTQLLSNGKSFAEANAWYEDFVYEGEGSLGSYWQQPGRSILRSLYKENNDSLIVDDRWDDVQVSYTLPDPLTGEIKIEKTKENAPFLLISKEGTISQFIGYLNTWSSSHKWNVEHGEGDAGKVFLNGLNWDLNASCKWTLKCTCTVASKKLNV
ncbi:trans-aconitate 3-methyltransferase [Martiniozyma asiatica (nom. inval.)]|nr:trans-aconitate 3-methyltransferase [Martiniozyma asiatica]